MWPGVESDHVGDYIQVLVNRDLYTDTAVFKAAYWLTDRLYVFLDFSSDGRLLVELRPKTPCEPNQLQKLCAEFCNHLIDYRVRGLVIKETGPIREALIAKAFSEGLPKPGLAGLESDERHLHGTNNPNANV